MTKVLSIVDSYQWALAHRANALKNHLPQFDFTIKYFKDLDNIDFNDFDTVFTLNWPIHPYISNRLSKNKKYKLVTSICSRVDRPPARSMHGVLDKYDAISASNKILYQEFSSEYRGKILYTPFGTDTDLFLPKTKPSEFSNVLGWVGNFERPVKRFKIIKNIIESIDEAVLKTATHKNMYSREEMVEFYNSVGTLIMFSKSEGASGPILEAGACGRAIIASAVGNVPDITKNNKLISIVKDDGELKKAIMNHIKNPQKLDIMGNLLREKISNDFSWKKQSQNFIKLLKP